MTIRSRIQPLKNVIFSDIENMKESLFTRKEDAVLAAGLVEGRDYETIVTATVIFDNAGGVTVQLRKGLDSWAHYYESDLRAAAGDVHAALCSHEFGHYDGDEEDALACAPTDEQIRNGGYRVHTFDSVEEFEEFCFDPAHQESWGNIRELTEWVRRGEL